MTKEQEREREKRLGKIAVAKSWTLPGVGPFGSDVEVVSLDAYKQLAARCENSEATCLMWARKCMELEGKPPTGWDDFNKEGAAQIIGALRLPVMAVLDHLQEDEDDRIEDGKVISKGRVIGEQG